LLEHRASRYRSKGRIRRDTPAHGSRENTLDVARQLIDSGADIEAKDNDGWKPLHEAAANNSLGVARLLIEHGANTDGIDLSWMN